jgi:4-amino-4-deoxy-L-arabinose transferase-like glycosyltransferase
MNSTVESGYGQLPTRSPSENRPLRAAGAKPRAARPTFAQLGGDQPYVEGNQMGQHPPVYYYAAAAVLRVVPGSADWPWDRLVHLLRLLSVLMVLPIPLLSFVTARRLGGSEAVGLAASAFTLAVPEFATIGSSVNNDNLLALLMSAAILLVAYVATGDRSRRTALLIGGVGAIALLTKGLVLFFPIWIAVVYAAAAWRSMDPRLMRSGAVAVGSSALLGGWWWARNLAIHGTVQPRGLIGPPLLSSPAEPYTLADKGLGWANKAASLLSSRFWVEHSMTRSCAGPPLTPCRANTEAGWIAGWTTVATVVTLLLIVAAFVAAVRRRHALLPLVAIALPFGFAFAQLIAVDWLEFAHSGAPSGLQGRYFFLALVGIAVLFALGAAAIAGRHTRWLPVLVLAGAAALHTRTVVTVLGNHWNGSVDGLRAALDAATAWSALPPC